MDHFIIQAPVCASLSSDWFYSHAISLVGLVAPHVKLANKKKNINLIFFFLLALTLRAKFIYYLEGIFIDYGTVAIPNLML